MRTESVVVLACAALAVALAISPLLSTSGPTAPFEGPLPVRAEPVALDPEAPSRDRVGALLYRGGLRLRSEEPRFGGLSDLRVSADGSRLFAVSDCGYGFTAELSYDARQRLAGLQDARFVELVGRGGRALGPNVRDAESLVATASTLEVGFEGANRVLAYHLAPPFRGQGRRLPVPPDLRVCAANGGIEAMAAVGRGERLLVCETRRTASLDVPAWIGGGGRWTKLRYPLLFEGGWGGEPFRPTAAAELPGGDLLVLERRFPPLAARIVRLSRDELRPGSGKLQPREIARFEPPLTIDNFEGIELRRGAGETFVYVLSDDNACVKSGSWPKGRGLQQTLLLMFALDTDAAGLRDSD